MTKEARRCNNLPGFFHSIREINDLRTVVPFGLHGIREMVFTCFTGKYSREIHNLALMNAMLHDLEGEIILGDTLSNAGKNLKGFEVVLTNPPFGTKKGGERVTRDDFTYPTSNKQLNFLQHIYRSLRTNGKSRAAVVLPDNVLFADGDGAKIRAVPPIFFA